jgi:hypothetical protein
MIARGASDHSVTPKDAVFDATGVFDCYAVQKHTVLKRSVSHDAVLSNARGGADESVFDNASSTDNSWTPYRTPDDPAAMS